MVSYFVGKCILFLYNIVFTWVLNIKLTQSMSLGCAVVSSVMCSRHLVAATLNTQTDLTEETVQNRDSIILYN